MRFFCVLWMPTVVHKDFEFRRPETKDSDVFEISDDITSLEDGDRKIYCQLVLSQSKNIQVIVDCIFEHHTGIPDTAIDIICRYQKEPRRSNENSFSFKIAADIPVGYNFPYTNMVFTCSEDFESYETLYQRGRLIKAPNIPNSITPIANGQYYLLYNLQNVEIMRVVDASCPNNVRMEAVAEDRTITSLTLSLANQGQILPCKTE